MSGIVYDPLLLCLSYLTAHFGRSKSPESLIRGLPYTEEGLSPSVFVEAAQRNSLRAGIRSIKDLKGIQKCTLPVVLLLKNNCACVVLRVLKDKAEVWDPADGKRKIALLKDLQDLYTQKIISVTASPEFIDPVLKEVQVTGSQWFRKALIENSSIYSKVLLASVLINIFALVSPVFIMNIYDRVIPNNAMETGWALSIGALVVFIADFIIRTLRGYFIDYAGKNVDTNLARRLFDQILDMKYAYKPSSSGAYANMLKEFDGVRDFITSATMVTLVDLPFSLLFLGMIFYLAGPIGLVVLGLMAGTVVAGMIIQIPLKKYVQSTLKTAETKHGLLVETIHALETIKTIAADGKIRARYAAHVAANSNHALKSRYYSALGVNFAVFMQQIAAIVIVLIGMYFVKDGLLTMGGLIASVILAGRALTPITQVANLLSRYHQTKSSLGTLNKIMALPTERPQGQDFLHRPDLKGNIRFDRVSFQYPNSGRKILDDVSFSIQAGEKIGIIGKVGSGKTTISKLLLKLYEPTEGGIYIDGTDYLQIEPSDLRNKIAYMSQEVTLLQGSIRENISASVPHADEESILRAAKLSGAHQFIALHPMGYDAPVGERGDGLSGGQKQCIALARALLLQPSILVCDEPTNSMDLQTEDNFIKLIQNEFHKDQTLILITHRTSLLPCVDRLIVVDNGQIVMDGKRDQVLAALSPKKAMS